MRFFFTPEGERAKRASLTRDAESRCTPAAFTRPQCRLPTRLPAGRAAAGCEMMMMMMMNEANFGSSILLKLLYLLGLDVT